MTEWRKFHESYEVSSDGQVRSLARIYQAALAALDERREIDRYFDEAKCRQQTKPFKDVAAPQAMIYSRGDDAAQDSGQWSAEQIAAIIDPHVINRLPAPQAVIQKPTGVFTVCVSVNGTPIVQSPEPPEEGLMQSDAKAVKEWREKTETADRVWFGTYKGTWTTLELGDPGRGLDTVAPMGHRLGGWGIVA